MLALECNFVFVMNKLAKREFEGIGKHKVNRVFNFNTKIWAVNLEIQ